MSFLDRCTEGAKRALALAQEAARAMGHNYVGSEHLLLGLIREGEGAAFKALSAFGVTANAVAERADTLVGRGDYHFTDSFGYTPRTKKILELSLYEAKSLKMGYIGTEHILLASGTRSPCASCRISARMCPACNPCLREGGPPGKAPRSPHMRGRVRRCSINTAGI